MNKIKLFIVNFKADWNNHLVAFGATVFGIIIALQLENWQDSRNGAEKLGIAIKSLKMELIENRASIEFDISHFKSFVENTDAIITYKTSDSTLTCQLSALDSLKSKFPDIFAEQKRRHRIGNSGIEFSYDLEEFINFVPDRIRTDNWEAIKSSGQLSSFPQNQLFAFARAYGELTRNFSATETDDFLIYVRDGHAHGKKLDIGILNGLAKNILGNLDMKIMWMSRAPYTEIMKY